MNDTSTTGTRTNPRDRDRRTIRFRVAAAATLLVAAHGGAHAQSDRGDVAPKERGGMIDYRNARALELPRASVQALSPARMAREAQGAQRPGAWGVVLGSEGDGRLTPEHVPVPAPDPADDDDHVAPPPEGGTSGHPYTTSVPGTPSNVYYRKAGKLFFKKPDGKSYTCSASLIRRGLVVTAAHCVAKFGANQLYTDFRFMPGYDRGSAPFGVWTAREARLMPSYRLGTDACSQSGVVCQNDIAVIVLAPKSDGSLPGARTGWYTFAWGNYSFFASGVAAITQIGYPGNLNSGQEQIRTDSQGAISPANAYNTLLGSLQGKGSSGGPWLVNFGKAPTLTRSVFGSMPDHNVVVGVTSWGDRNEGSGRNQLGASPFTEFNIKPLVADACAEYPDACAP